MSGGSYNYAYRHIEEFGESIRTTTPERLAFRRLVLLVAEAAHDLEWVDSGDYSKGDEVPAIMLCVTRADVIEAALKKAEAVRDELISVIEKARGELGK